MNNITTTAIYLVVAAMAAVIFYLTKHRKRKNGEKQSQNYKGLFIIGISWIPIGVVTENYVFVVIGIVFMIIGLRNKDKWKGEPKWSDLSNHERRFSIIIIAGVIVLAIVAILVVLLLK